MGGISIWHWVVVLVIVVLVFGTKKLRNVGKDLGGAVHDFKKGLDDSTESNKTNGDEQKASNDIIDASPKDENKE